MATPAARAASSIAPLDGLGLVDRLLELVGGLGVGDRAAAGLDVRAAVLDHDRADVDAGVEVAGVAEVADRAAVAAALDRLELVDDLHRADLRRAAAACRPAGSSAARPSAPTSSRSVPRHRRDDVHDVRVGLDRHERVDRRRVPYSQTRPRSLRPRSTSITCSARSFSSASSSSAIRASSAASPPRGRVPAIGRVEAWRPVTVSSGSGEAPATWKSRKSRKYMYGRRVDHPQAAVDRERVERRGRRVQRWDGHDLERVAGVDVLDDPRDHRPRTARAACWSRTPARVGRGARRSRLGHRAVEQRARLRRSSRPRRRRTRRASSSA